METYALETRNLTKIFPGVIALNNVSIKLKKGEVHGIVGENGAGKSTLIMTLDGQYVPEEGEIYIYGEKMNFTSAQDAANAGVSVVFQELSLVPTLSIAENIYANNQPRTKLGTIDWRRMWKNTAEVLKLLELDMDPHTPVQSLSNANRQLIEILKAVSVKPQILILDEPTSSLTALETRKLFSLIKKLKEEGSSIIYISHHLHEIFTVCDTVTVMKDGCHVCDANVADIDENFLISKMVGREVTNIYGTVDPNRKIAADPILKVENLSGYGEFYDVSFEVYEGKITSLAGLVGAGRTEVCKCIFGMTKPSSGKIIYEGKEQEISCPGDAIALGISYLTEDRKNEGLYLHESIEFNLYANQVSTKIKNKVASAEDIIAKYSVACRGKEQVTETLSGGNQQKVMLAEWVEIMPKLLMIDEPTRGIDVGAKSEIYKILRELASQGMAILMVSSDLPELLHLSDEVIVMKSGTVAGKLKAEEATEETVMKLAAGSWNEEISESSR